jgi:glycosyltransferase involved in cell wall biosynthesis
MYDAARALGVPDARLCHIPWGIETDVFKPTPDDGIVTRQQLGVDASTKLVLCPRAIKPIYNIDVVLGGMKTVVAQGLDARLVLLHYSVDSDYLVELERKIAVYGLESSVLWLPAQETASDMARLYRASDAVISIPSSDGYGFSVYEAMAAGCPTVVSDLPLFQNELVDGVHTAKVPVRDVAQTGQALTALLTQAELRQKLTRNALDVSQQKSVDHRIRRVTALYEELAERSPRTRGF